MYIASLVGDLKRTICGTAAATAQPPIADGNRLKFTRHRLIYRLWRQVLHETQDDLYEKLRLLLLHPVASTVH